MIGQSAKDSKTSDEQIKCAQLLLDIVSTIPEGDCPFKNFFKSQLETYGKAASFHIELSALEQSGRDAESRLNAQGCLERLERMIISVRQIKKCSEEVEKFLATELVTQTLGDNRGLNPADYRMDKLYMSILEDEVLQDVVSLQGQQLLEKVKESQEKAADLARGRHTGETSWKYDIADTNPLKEVLRVGEAQLSSVSGEKLVPAIKELEEDW